MTSAARPIDTEKGAVATRHAFDVAILPADIDALGHVNNAVYLRWVQDAVVAHWQSVAPADAVARHLWIAIKHEISYRRPAYLLDKIVATATLRRFAGVRAFYRTVIGRGADIVAEVESCWCCLDSTTLRPAKLPPDVIERFFVRG